MPRMEFKTILSKFIYRIEAKPGGGFIATCKDPTAPPIEGATREEVQQKIQENIAANLATQFPALKSALEAKGVTLHYHVEAKPGGGFIVHHDDAAHDSADHSTHGGIESFIESKIFSAFMDRLPPELLQQFGDKLNAEGADIEVKRTFRSSSTESGVPHFSPVLGEVGTSPSDLQTAQATTQSPIIRYDSDSPVKYEKSSFGIFLRLLIAAAALAAIAYILFLRR
jgi:hypothetical protein